MTNEEILEVKKLVSDMRDTLTLLGNTTDANKLVALVTEKEPIILYGFFQISLEKRLRIFGGVEGLEGWYDDVVVLGAVAEMAQRRPDFVEKLQAEVATKVPHAIAILDKVIARLEPTAL